MLINQKKEGISFSIIMANFNNSKYINEAIESVIAQTYPNWELIIVDDCSMDNSLDIIQPYLKDKRIKLIKLKKNRGVGFSKNIGCTNASNDIIGILDADDKLHENALEIVAKAYKGNPKLGFIYSTMWDCDSELKKCKLNQMIGPISPEKSNILNIKVSHFKTFRRDIYFKTKGYDPTLQSAVDKDIIYKIEEITKFAFIDTPLYYYRHHKSGISQDKNQFKARINHYISKYKTYQRRQYSNLPNITLRELYIEYYKIAFHKIVLTFRFLSKLFKVPQIIKKANLIFPFIILKIKRLLLIVAEILIDIKIRKIKSN